MVRLPGGQQSRGDSLHRSSGEDLDTGTESARHRGDPEPGDSPDVGTPPTEAVTQRPAEQDQRCQGQGVATEDPLEARQIGSQVAAARGQGDVEERAVQDGDTAAQNGGEYHDPSARVRGPQLSAFWFGSH